MDTFGDLGFKDCPGCENLRAQLEQARRLLKEWCSVPWQHKTPEMLDKTRAWLEGKDADSR